MKQCFVLDIRIQIDSELASQLLIAQRPLECHAAAAAAPRCIMRDVVNPAIIAAVGAPSISSNIGQLTHSVTHSTHSPTRPCLSGFFCWSRKWRQHARSHLGFGPTGGRQLDDCRNKIHFIPLVRLCILGDISL